MPPEPVGSAEMSDDPRDRVIARLRAELDEVSQQLLQARDAVVGAEAELSVARARVAEVEHHLHVTTVEVDELREKILALAAAPDAEPERPKPVTRRLSPLLARTARTARLGG